MRRFSRLLVVIVLAATALAQNSSMKVVPEAEGVLRTHAVRPGSRGNEIVLSLTNNQNALASDSLMVWVIPSVSAPQRSDQPTAGLRISPTMQVVASPKRGESTPVIFTLDVSEDVARAQTDTVRFLVVSRGGPLVRKTVLLNYSVPATYKLGQNFPNPRPPELRAS